MLCHDGVGGGAVFAESAGSNDLVEAHKAGIASHIGGHYCRQPAPHPTWLIWKHGV
jgi:hypothetical protein